MKLEKRKSKTGVAKPIMPPKTKNIDIPQVADKKNKKVKSPIKKIKGF